MASFSLTASAEQLVSARFSTASVFAGKAEKEAFTLINALVAIAKQAAGIDISATVPLDQPPIPTSPAFSGYLVAGATGLPVDADAIIWQRCIDRAAAVLTDSLGRISEQFGLFSELPDGMLDALIQMELDQHSWHIRDIGRAKTVQMFNIEAEFAKLVVGKMAEWSLMTYEMDLKQAISTAELLLKQSEIQIKELLEKSGLELTGYESAADTAAHLAGSVLQSVSASASLSSSENDNSATSATTSNSNETRTVTTKRNTTQNENAETVLTGS